MTRSKRIIVAIALTVFVVDEIRYSKMKKGEVIVGKGPKRPINIYQQTSRDQVHPLHSVHSYDVIILLRPPVHLGKYFNE